MLCAPIVPLNFQDYGINWSGDFFFILFAHAYSIAGAEICSILWTIREGGIGDWEEKTIGDLREIDWALNTFIEWKSAHVFTGTETFTNFN